MSESLEMVVEDFLGYPREHAVEARIDMPDTQARAAMFCISYVLTLVKEGALTLPADQIGDLSGAGMAIRKGASEAILARMEELDSI